MQRDLPPLHLIDAVLDPLICQGIEGLLTDSAILRDCLIKFAAFISHGSLRFGWAGANLSQSSIAEGRINDAVQQVGARSVPGLVACRSGLVQAPLRDG